MRGRLVHAVLALVVVFGLVLAAWALDLQQAIPVDQYGHGTGDPLFQRPQQLLALAADALRPYGGLPRDAVPYQMIVERATIVAPAAPPPVPNAFTMTFVPRSSVIWNDHVIVSIGSRERARCADGGWIAGRDPPTAGPACRRYRVDVTFAPYRVARAWRPPIVRAWERWRADASLPMVAMPDHVDARCTVDLATLRRILAAPPDLPKGALWQADRAQPGYPFDAAWWRARTARLHPGDVLLRWSHPWQLGLGRPAWEVDAVLYPGETPDDRGGAYVVHLVRPARFLGPAVFLHQSIDELPCPGDPPPPQIAGPGAVPLDRDNAVAILEERALGEVAARVHAGWGTLPSSAAELTSVDRHDPTHVVVHYRTHLAVDGTWDAAFVLDTTEPALRSMTFTREDAAAALSPTMNRRS